MASRNAPVAELRNGLVGASIWHNDADSGTRYNVTFSRLYRDGDPWKNTRSFGRNDLLAVAKVDRPRPDPRAPGLGRFRRRERTDQLLRSFGALRGRGRHRRRSPLTKGPR